MAHENDWVINDGIPFRQSYPELIESINPNEEWLAKEIGQVPTDTWVSKNWGEFIPLYGSYIWTDGTNLYYSQGTGHYVFNKQTSTWESKTWYGLTDFNGSYVWTDGENVYWSYRYDHYILNKETDTWEPKTWYGITSLFFGSDVWTDGNNIYYSFNQQYILNKQTSTWEQKTWYGLTGPSGSAIWKDGDSIYYSSGSKQYVLDKTTSTWTVKTWNGLTSFNGRYVWTDGNTFYISNYSQQYVLDKSTSTWTPKTWYGMDSSLNNFVADWIWTYGNKIYFSWTNNYQYELLPGREITSTPYRLNFPELKESIDPHDKWLIDDDIPYRLNFPEMIESIDLRDKWLADTTGAKTKSWIDKVWSGYAPRDADNIWTDGENTYYSGRSRQYILDNTTGEWVPKTWYGLNSFIGIDVWTDGTDIYYSELYDSTPTYLHYVLDKSTSTWSIKTWSGFTHIIGRFIWTDGTDIYYSFGSWQYVLDKSTSTWSTKIWSGLTNFSARDVWTDGTDIYYSIGSSQYVLDKSTSTWSTKIWSGLTNFSARDVWTDSNNIYYSYNSVHRVLDKSTSTWLPKTWSGFNGIRGLYIWTDGENTYFSDDYHSQQYVLTSRNVTDIPYRLNFPELIPSVDLNSWLIDDDIPFRRNFPPLIPSIDPDSWLIDDDIPFRLDFPPLIPSAVPSDAWLQDKGWDPRRPWPEHRSIIQKVQTIPNIPDVDWTKSMQQTFEFYTVDPNNWYDDQKLENIISCDLTHDLTSDKRGNASISVTEPLPESYIRTYLVVTQAGYMHKICLGTYLYMTSSDSFDGMKHNITMTGYTPMVELEEKLPPLGFHIIGITNRKHSGDAPMVTDAIKDIVTTYTRCEIENRTVIQKPLLNDFVAGTNDNFLTVINNVLNASSLGQYILTVDEWGTIIVKDKPVLEDAIPTYIYTDDNSSILLPSLDTNDDIYGIPNVVEVLYTGDKRLPAIRVTVKNEDPTSIVSIPSRGREIAKRFTITNIAAPVNDYSEAAVRAQVTAQAERLLEAASTINKTISYSHGYCDVKVGDTVLINYERAGVTGIRAKVVSQRISCKPGCQVDEQAVYTKKLWNRGV